MSKQTDVWIMVANAVKARFFMPEGDDNLLEFNELNNPDGHLKTHELVSDKQGRSFGRIGSSHYGQENGKKTPAELQHAQFAREIIHYLEKALAQKQFSQLTLFAGPEMLGILRSMMPKHLEEVLVNTIAKDLTKASTTQIREEIQFPLIKVNKPTWA